MGAVVKRTQMGADEGRWTQMGPPIDADFRRFFVGARRALPCSLRALCGSVPLCEPQRRAASHLCHGEARPGAEGISYTVGETASADFGPPRGDMSRGNGAKRRLALCPPRLRVMASRRRRRRHLPASRQRGSPLTPPSRGIAAGLGAAALRPYKALAMTW